MKGREVPLGDTNVLPSVDGNKKGRTTALDCKGGCNGTSITRQISRSPSILNLYLKAEICAPSRVENRLLSFVSLFPFHGRRMLDYRLLCFL